MYRRQGWRRACWVCICARNRGVEAAMKRGRVVRNRHVMPLISRRGSCGDYFACSKYLRKWKIDEQRYSKGVATTPTPYLASLRAIYSLSSEAQFCNSVHLACLSGILLECPHLFLDAIDACQKHVAFLSLTSRPLDRVVSIIQKGTSAKREHSACWIHLFKSSCRVSS